MVSITPHHPLVNLLLNGIPFTRRTPNVLRIKALMEDIRRIEESDSRAADGQTDPPPHPLREAREALEKLIVKMDHLEADFDRFAEKSSESLILTLSPRNDLSYFTQYCLLRDYHTISVDVSIYLNESLSWELI